MGDENENEEMDSTDDIFTNILNNFSNNIAIA